MVTGAEPSEGVTGLYVQEGDSRVWQVILAVGGGFPVRKSTSMCPLCVASTSSQKGDVSAIHPPSQ